MPVPGIVVDPPTETALRYQVRFPEREAMVAALAAEVPTEHAPVVGNLRRGLLSVALPLSPEAGDSALANENETLRLFEREFGGRIVEDFQYDMDFQQLFTEENFLEAEAASASLDDVLTAVRARECWADTRGEDVYIAVVDTGIDGSRPEFPEWKRAGAWQAMGQQPWTDWKGHGTMCASIAAGTREAGGAFDGIAPGARLIACKTRFFDSELTTVYDYLSDLAVEKGWNIVATNSFGIQTGSAPAPGDVLFPEALRDAIQTGVKVFFSAGNYHELAGGAPDACGPTSIWLYKCRDDVMTVATCNLSERMWSYSSRGPGQHFGTAGHAQKPDVTAPTPENGRVVYGASVVALKNGWGTSGACPQAAGLASLLLSRRPELNFSEVFDVIRNSARSLTHAAECQGRGMIDCRAALDSL